MTTDLVRYTEPTSAFDLAPKAWTLACRVAGTDFVPTALRGKPEAVLACILAGHEAGVGPMQSLAKIHIIEGRPAMAAELMRALVMRAGHDIWIEESSSTRCIIGGKRSGSSRESKVSWTMDDAKRAGLQGKAVWQKYPSAMLLARATAHLCRMIFADVLAGISYTIEELDDGDDPNTLALGAPEVADGAGTVSTPPVRATARARAAATRGAPDAPVDDPAPPPERSRGELPPLPGEEESPIEDAEIVEDAEEPGEVAYERNELAPPPPAPDQWDGPGDPPPPDDRRYSGPQLIAMKLERFGVKGSSDAARARRLLITGKLAGREIGSSKDLTPEETSSVIETIDAIPDGWSFDEAGDLIDPEAAGGPPPESPDRPATGPESRETPPPTPSSTPDPSPKPQRGATAALPRDPEVWSADDWRVFLKARKVKVSAFMQEAGRVGAAASPTVSVGTLDAIAGSGLAGLLVGYVEDAAMEAK